MGRSTNMAAKKEQGDFSFAEKDKIQWEKYNKKLEEEAIREEKLYKHWEWAGNKLPPIAIEPQPLERNRLAKPMTDAQRAARAQWLADQAVSEPVFVPELYPRNIFRRMLRAPGDKEWPHGATKEHDEFYSLGFKYRTSHLGPNL